MKTEFKLAIFLLVLALVSGASFAQAADTCSGNVYSDRTAAQACADLAEAQAIARGYTADCTVTTSYLPTGSFLDATCTINGSTGHSATLLAGYDDPNSVVPHVNPGWATLQRELNPSTSVNTTVNTGSTATQSPAGNSGASFVTLPAQYSSNVALQNATNLINSFFAKTNTFCASTANLNLSSDAQAEVLKNTLCGSSFVKDLITQNYQKQINNLNAVLSGNGGATLVPNGSTPVTTTPTPVVSGVLPSPQNFRYLKVNTTENGWVSWREIEFYDTSGNKVTPTSATASSFYDGKWQNPVVPAEVASNVFDGNEEVVWNAGETAVGCNSFKYGPECPGASRSAWIQIDLGAVKNIAKVVFVENGDTQTENDTASISSDGTNFTTLTTFAAPIRDADRLQWPAATYAGNPTVTLTVNGSHSANVNYHTQVGPGHQYDTMKFDWNASNADYINIVYSSVVDPLATTPSPSGLNCDAVNSQTSANPFGNQWVGVNNQEVLPMSGTKTASAANVCQVGHIMTIKFTAIQRYTGKSVSDTVTVRTLLVP